MSCIMLADQQAKAEAKVEDKANRRKQDELISVDPRMAESLSHLGSQNEMGSGSGTVLARNVPQGSSHSLLDNVDGFFKKNHPGHYLCHQVVYNANKFGRLVGRSVGDFSVINQFV
nr:CSC1-like protein At1g32090 [Tanacetum cinerariifolium]